VENINYILTICIIKKASLFDTWENVLAQPYRCIIPIMSNEILVMPYAFSKEVDIVFYVKNYGN